MALRLKIFVLCGVVGALWASAAHASVTRVATLSLSAGVGSTIGSVVVSPGTAVVAGSSGDYVFEEPVGGWTSKTESAKLTDSGSAVISGQTIVVGTPQTATSPPGLDVFVEPAGGWSGIVSPTARLVASDGLSLGPTAIAGHTVASVAWDPHAVKGYVYVFNEPPGGWAGTVHESAKLSDSHGASFREVATTGQSIVASSDGTLYGNHTDVFAQPSGGWDGPLSESASVPNGLNPVAISGHTILAGGRVFIEPSHGWSGSLRPQAQILAQPGPGDDFGGIPGYVSGTTVSAAGGKTGSGHSCPCRNAVWLFSQPPGGWRGTILAQPVISTVSGLPVPPTALDTNDLFVGIGSAVDVYEFGGTFGHHVRPPALTGFALSGVAQRKPQLRFTLRGAAQALPLRTVTVIVPQGLRFAPMLTRVRAGIRIVGARGYSLRKQGHNIQFVFKRLIGTARFTIRWPALTANKKHPQTRNLTLRLRVGDTVGDSWLISRSR